MTESKLPADIKWELTILEIVNGFNVELLCKTLQDQFPTPAGLDPETLRAPSDPPKTLANMRTWLKLLDLAITPAILRETLTQNIDQDLAEALLRYFVRKKSDSAYDRDKTDFLASYLYRNPRVKGQWESRGYSMDGVAPMPPFEIALLEILEDSDLPDIGPDSARVLSEFEYQRGEVENFSDFDELVDSGIMQRVREMKNSLGSALYHPHVLAVIAPYNALFAVKFEQLFKAATAHIKEFAEQVQQRGGSISTPVQGGVTVKQLAELNGEEILASEYLRAQEQLRYISKLKKAVDSRSAPQRAPQPAYGRPAPPLPRTPFAQRPAPPVAPPIARPVPPVAPPMARPTPAAAAPRMAPEITPGVTAGGPPPMSSGAKRTEEENRLHSVEESVRSFVKAADPRFRAVVPMGFGNLVLTTAEADAYCADYLKESSFRGENARVLVRIPALVARMTSEIEQIERQQNLKYLWRPHADSLSTLLAISAELSDVGKKLSQLATQRGLTDKVNALNTSLQKLTAKVGQANTLLTMMNARD